MPLESNQAAARIDSHCADPLGDVVGQTTDVGDLVPPTPCGPKQSFPLKALRAERNTSAAHYRDELCYVDVVR
jgi:hypothetical protein